MAGSARSHPDVTPKSAIGEAVPSAAFTPGPWAYRPTQHDDWGWVKDARGWMVAMARNPDVEREDYDGFRARGGDPFEANARLIAAAPELYEALKELNRECIASAERAGTTWPLSGPARALSDKVNAALAKAEGRQ